MAFTQPPWALGNAVGPGSMAVSTADSTEQSDSIGQARTMPCGAHVLWGSIEQQSDSSDEDIGVISSLGVPDSSWHVSRLPLDVLIIDTDSDNSSGVADECTSLLDHPPTNCHERSDHQPTNWHERSEEMEAADDSFKDEDEAENSDNPDWNSELLAAEEEDMIETPRSSDDEAIQALLEKVPVDQNGKEMSIGSIGHDEGRCRTPCAFAQREKGCFRGSRCNFCHYHHAERSRSRPCKGQRMRYRHQLEFLTSELTKSPETFDPNNVQLPPSIDGREAVKKRMFATLVARREQLNMLKRVNDWEESLTNTTGVAAASSSSSDAFCKLSL
jgi:hypothetical protein